MFEDLNSANFLAQLKQGDVAAFEKLARDLFGPLWMFLVGPEGVPKEDAEELAQDVLMKVYDKVETFRSTGAAKLTTWVFHIAINRAIDFHRATEQQLQDVPLEEENLFPIETHPDGQFSIRTWKQRMWLRDELEKLTPDDQQVLLWRMKDISYADIADWLQIREGTARVRYLRALAKLRKAALEMGEETFQGALETNSEAYV